MGTRLGFEWGHSESDGLQQPFESAPVVLTQLTFCHTDLLGACVVRPGGDVGLFPVNQAWAAEAALGRKRDL